MKRNGVHGRNGSGRNGASATGRCQMPCPSSQPRPDEQSDRWSSGRLRNVGRKSCKTAFLGTQASPFRTPLPGPLALYSNPRLTYARLRVHVAPSKHMAPSAGPNAIREPSRFVQILNLDIGGRNRALAEPCAKTIEYSATSATDSKHRLDRVGDLPKPDGLGMVSNSIRQARFSVPIREG